MSSPRWRYAPRSGDNPPNYDAFLKDATPPIPKTSGDNAKNVSTPATWSDLGKAVWEGTKQSPRALAKHEQDLEGLGTKATNALIDLSTKYIGDYGQSTLKGDGSPSILRYPLRWVGDKIASTADPTYDASKRSAGEAMLYVRGLAIPWMSSDR